MRGLDKYVTRVAAEERAQAAMSRLSSAIAKRDERRRKQRRRPPRPMPPTFTALPAQAFASAGVDRYCNYVALEDTARALIEGDELFVSRAPLYGLLVAPREETPLVTEPDADATVVPLVLSDVPVALFDGTGHVVSVRAWQTGTVPIYALCASEQATGAQPAALGLSKKDYADLQARATRMLGARLS